MRILLTGATGFVGRPLVAALLAAGHDVVAAVRGAPQPPLPADVAILTCPDLAEAGDWRHHLDGVDAVVHLAGIAHVGADIADAAYDIVNHRATAALASAAAHAGVGRFGVVSSIRAQTGPVADHELSEADEARPTDAYGRSKLAAETAVRGAGVAFTIVRPVAIYGPGMKGNFAALARLARWPLPLPFGALRNGRSLLSLDAMVAAILFILKTPATIGETYIAADATPIATAAIVAALRRGAGRRPLLVPVPPAVFRLAAKALGRMDLWDRIGGELVVSPARLIAAGWQPEPDSAAALARLGR
jgi:UDP-glucose 4-epimerase